MAQQAPLSSPSLQVFNRAGILRLLLLQVTVPATAFAQTPQQQYVFGSVPLRSATSQVAAYVKNGQTGALSAVPGSPFADSLPGGVMAVDALGRFLFVVNTSASNISMFQIDQSTGNLVEVPGSPFSSGPTENPSMAPTLPVCLAVEKSGQFLYVGYRTGGGSFSRCGELRQCNGGAVQQLPVHHAHKHRWASSQPYVYESHWRQSVRFCCHPQLFPSHSPRSQFQLRRQRGFLAHRRGSAPSKCGGYRQRQTPARGRCTLLLSLSEEQIQAILG